MAHIEQKSGFYNELDGGRIIEFGKEKIFRKSVLAFQKVRTRDYITNLNLWLDNKLPAFVEGSDPKSIAEIGKGQHTYLKLGAYNFRAIKYALLDHKFRIANSIPKPKNAYLKSITFHGGKLDGTSIPLSHSLNNLIGIRGSGKSSILEAIRYALDIDLAKNKNADFDYKNKLVNALLGSGGRITCVLVDKQGIEYRAEKILGERTAIYKDNELQLDLKPNAVIKNPIYFGQKDLSQIGEEYLIDKLVGSRLLNKKREIEDKNQEIGTFLSQLQEFEKKLERKPVFEEEVAELKIKIQVFKDNQIDKKLEKQILFDEDLNFINRIKDFEMNIISSLNALIDDYQDSFENFKTYKSKENTTDLKDVLELFNDFEVVFNELQNSSEKLSNKNQKLANIETKLSADYEKLKDEFAKIKREIDLPNIQADDYLKFTKRLNIIESLLTDLSKMSEKKKYLEIKLNQSLAELQKLWREEFEIIETEIKKINANQESIKINADFKGNKSVFRTYLKDNFRGCNLRESNIKLISEDFSDLIAVYTDLSRENSATKKNLSENQFFHLKKRFYENIFAFLTYKIPDKFEVMYKNRPLKEHSLGQRASALIIFLLSLKDSDLIIIDQPEDDLDNQTIYKDVIKVLKQLKNSTQFIFATHNPNIPVLGDCEQVISCTYKSNSIQINFGNIDKNQIRKDIVNIMEGGIEAFDNRKLIYELWTH